MASVSWDDHGVASLVQARTESATLPVVLCAPHGGNAADGDQSETLLERPVVSPLPRDVDNGGSGEKRRAPTVSRVADVGTAQLLEEIDRRITRKYSSGGGDGGFATAAVDAPAAVVARFHRKYVDANRPLENESAVATHPSCARAREVHMRYHRAIEAAISALGSRCGRKKMPSSPLGSSRGQKEGEEGVEGKEEGGGGVTGKGSEEEQNERKDARLLLLDIHGQSKFVEKVIIGTCHGKTADLEALNVPGKGFLWYLRRHLNVQKKGWGDRGGAASAEDVDDEKPNCPRGTHQREREETGGVGKERDHECQRGQAGRPAAKNNGVAIKRDEEAVQDDLVVVLPSPGGKEVAGYTGGYTVKRHGLLAGEGVARGGRSDEAAGAAGGGVEGAGRVAVVVDAIQLEFGAQFRRTPEARAAMAEAVAAAVFHHLQQH